MTFNPKGVSKNEIRTVIIFYQISFSSHPNKSKYRSTRSCWI